ncbi:hypothetical protein E2C01_101077 [Portunus trituberculatus]|uniref:Uncharacterized protein n=1 Tax=Portunus trituberculatus TaxID=210409 RepID=A0A5B7KJ55_PORTR|nr:hypothetical protein [Portunus trituberculatus]
MNGRGEEGLGREEVVAMMLKEEEEIEMEEEEEEEEEELFVGCDISRGPSSLASLLLRLQIKP